MNYILFEDKYFSLLYPLTLTHPVFEIRNGAYTNIERIENLIDKNDSLILLVRKEMESIIKKKYPAYIINPEIVPKGILINSSCIWEIEHFNRISDKKTYTCDKKLISAYLENDIEIKINYIEYLWDSIFLSKEQLSKDYSTFINKKNGIIHPSVILENDELIFIEENCKINAGVVLDATEGPIIIRRGTKLDIGSLIKGPVYIGPKCIINPGSKIRNNVIVGPLSKIGGEVEDSIIQGYSNKQHDGFLGHSYIGEWVNLGANTNNSDLKNNYSTIKFHLKDKIIETNKIFLGVMIGDYTRTAISTTFNTGTCVGIGANIFKEIFNEKYIPSFRWGNNDITDIDKFIDTCKKMKERRNLNLDKEEEDLLRYLFKNEIK